MERKKKTTEAEGKIYFSPNVLVTDHVELNRHLTHSFFQGGWHFPENPKIDGDTDPFLKSGKILNHHAAPARICNSKI